MTAQASSVTTPPSRSWWATTPASSSTTPSRATSTSPTCDGGRFCVYSDSAQDCNPGRVYARGGRARNIPSGRPERRPRCDRGGPIRRIDRSGADRRGTRHLRLDRVPRTRRVMVGPVPSSQRCESLSPAEGASSCIYGPLVQQIAQTPNAAQCEKAQGPTRLASGRGCRGASIRAIRWTMQDSLSGSNEKHQVGRRRRICTRHDGRFCAAKILPAAAATASVSQRSPGTLEGYSSPSLEATSNSSTRSERFTNSALQVAWLAGRKRGGQDYREAWASGDDPIGGCRIPCDGSRQELPRDDSAPGTCDNVDRPLLRG